MTPLLSAKDVAALLGLKVSTIWRRCEEGRMVPPPVLQRPYRFNATQVQAVLEGTYTAEKQARKFFGRFKSA